MFKYKTLKYDNLQDINFEVNNYKNFRKILIDFLNNNPIITYKDFFNEALKISLMNKCTFSIYNNIFINAYYNWRKSSN